MSRSILVFLLCSAFQITLSAQDLSFQTPELVVRGRSFTGIVVDPHTNETPALPEDAQVHTRDFTLRIDTPGIVFPPVKAAGNSFLEGRIANPQGDALAKVESRHVESVPVFNDPDVPAISRVQDIVQPGDVMTVEGLGLERLTQPRLKGQGGSSYPLERRFSSDLQQGFLVPPDLAEGKYQFQAVDENGNTITATDTTSYPELEITGPRVKRRGQKGDLRIRCSEDALLGLIVSEDVIELFEIAGMMTFPVQSGPAFRTLPAKAGEWIEIPFVAKQAGQWTATAYTFSERNRPDSLKGFGVEPVAESPMAVQYSPDTDKTTVSQRFSIRQFIDGTAVPNVHVDFLLSHPDGVEYFTEVTDADGLVSMSYSVPGRCTQDVLYTAPYRVWERQYKLGPIQDEDQGCKAEIVCYKPVPCNDICYRCERKVRNSFFQLKADVHPKGGKYLWEKLDGAGSFKFSTNTIARTQIQLNSKAENVDTIRVKLSYTVDEQTCLDTQTVVVRRPASLGVIDKWLYISNKNNITVQHNGKASSFQAMSEDQQQRIQKVTGNMNDSSIGVVLLVYYEVLDQHGEKFPCDGHLEEEISPMRQKLKTGGIDIVSGRPKNPDHIYYIHDEEKFEEHDLRQEITVNGCVVRYNKIEIRKSGVTLIEVDKDDE